MVVHTMQAMCSESKISLYIIFNYLNTPVFKNNLDILSENFNGYSNYLTTPRYLSRQSKRRQWNNLRIVFLIFLVYLVHFYSKKYYLSKNSTLNLNLKWYNYDYEKILYADLYTVL